jgi:hypothetical protein
VDRPGDQGGHDLSQEASLRRRPWWIWTAPFAVLFLLLCVRNRFLFTQKLYEQGDGGANSILIAQAKRFALLVGNYSREGFHHPGPGYMYPQALGEWLLQNVLHVVPTAWNAHILTVFALNCMFAALAVGVAYGWTRSLAGAAITFAVIVVWAIQYPPIINSDWMPYMYVMPYVVFVIAAASVMAGADRDAWIMALSGWLLIHGHACFLFFVPLVTVVVVAYRWWPRVRAGKVAPTRGVWLPAAIISFVFALPIVINLILHWPGDFGHYISYGKSGKAGGHGATAILRYALWYWWPHPSAHLAIAVISPVVLCALALGVTRWLAPPAVRPFCWALLAVDLVSTIGALFYATAGVDDLSETYIEYFYWSAPLVVVLVIVLGVVEAASRQAAVAAGTVALATATAVTAYFAVIPGTLTSTNDIDPALPRTVSTLAERAAGKTVVLRLADHSTWVQTTGLLMQAERTGVRICVDNPELTFLFTAQFICTPAQVASGRAFWLFATTGPDATAPPGIAPFLQFSGIEVIVPAT